MAANAEFYTLAKLFFKKENTKFPGKQKQKICQHQASYTTG